MTWFVGQRRSRKAESAGRSSAFKYSVVGLCTKKSPRKSPSAEDQDLVGRSRSKRFDGFAMQRIIYPHQTHAESPTHDTMPREARGIDRRRLTIAGSSTVLGHIRLQLIDSFTGLA